MRKYYFIILICLPALVNAQGSTNKLPDENAVAVLPFRLNERHIIISAQISNTADSLHFIFDTGAEVTTLHEGTAKKLDLKGRQEGGVSGTNDVMIKVGTITLNVLYLDRIRLPYVKAYLENLQEFRKGTIPIDGIIGVDLLKAYIVKIDYENRQLLLYRPGKTPPGVKGQLIPIKLNFATPVLDAAIKLPDGQTLTSRYHFISGGEYGILFNWPYVEKHRLNTLLPALNTEKVQDLIKTLTYTNTSLPSLTMGPQHVEEVPASYSEDVNDAGSLSEVAGSIGFYVWRQFRSITINYARRELFLEN